ncbi:MAG: oligoribonuclease [Candidatus Altiarchaeota archaeon]
MERSNDALVWVDMEFSGLDFDKDVILEIATVVTDSNLDLIAEGPAIAIHQEEPVLYGMDEWNTKHHGESGLVERVIRSRQTHESAEQKTLKFLSDHCEPNLSPLCGNSVHQDRWFMRRHMPTLEAFFHYRNIDVSSLKELSRRWFPNLPEFKKAGTHNAAKDIMESIEELRHYRREIFIRQP